MTLSSLSISVAWLVIRTVVALISCLQSFSVFALVYVRYRQARMMVERMSNEAESEAERHAALEEERRQEAEHQKQAMADRSRVERSLRSHIEQLRSQMEEDHKAHKKALEKQASFQHRRFPTPPLFRAHPHNLMWDGFMSLNRKIQPLNAVPILFLKSQKRDFEMGTASTYNPSGSTVEVPEKMQHLQQQLTDAMQRERSLRKSNERVRSVNVHSLALTDYNHCAIVNISAGAFIHILCIIFSCCFAA